MTVHDKKSLVPPRSRSASVFAPIQREIDRVFADFGDFNAPDLFGPSPRMDLRETDDTVELTMKLPGMIEKDIKVELQDDLLTISGDKESETETVGKGYRVMERRFGRFARAIHLPAGVDAENISASLKDGVLKITAPRAPGSEAREISIPITAA